MNKKKFWEYTIQTLFGIFAGLWLLGIIIQFLRVWPNQDYSALTLYGQIALTLFGVTLLGGIFERNQIKSKIELQLFDTCLIFLTTALCLFFAYGISGVMPEPLAQVELINLLPVVSFGFALIFGFLGFTLGFVQLFFILRAYRNEISKNQDKQQQP